MKYVDKVYSHRKRFSEYLCCLKLLKYCTSCDLKKIQMSGRDRHVFGGQGPQKPMSSVQAEEVSANGHEQRW